MGFTDLIISYNFIFRLLVLLGTIVKAVGFWLECPQPQQAAAAQSQASVARMCRFLCPFQSIDMKRID
jgi:hypothetical protein